MGKSKFGKQISGKFRIVFPCFNEDFSPFFQQRCGLFREGTTDEIFSSPDGLSDIGLDVPEIATLAARLRAGGIALSGTLYTVDGVCDALLRWKEAHE